MTHRNCGGEISEAADGRGYHFDGEDARQFGAFVPAYVCLKCGVEILGDRDVIVPGQEEDN